MTLQEYGEQLQSVITIIDRLQKEKGSQGGYTVYDADVETIRMINKLDNDLRVVLYNIVRCATDSKGRIHTWGVTSIGNRYYYDNCSMYGLYEDCENYIIDEEKQNDIEAMRYDYGIAWWQLSAIGDWVRID